MIKVSLDDEFIILCPQKIFSFKEFMTKFTELKNTYLTMFYGIQETERALIFVFEWVPEGPLDQYVKNER